MNEIKDLADAIREKRAITISNTGQNSIASELFKVASSKISLLNDVKLFVGKDANSRIPIWNSTLAIPAVRAEGITGVSPDTTNYLSTTSITPHAYISLLPITNETLVFTGSNLESELPKLFGEAFYKAMFNGMLNGTGSNGNMAGLFTAGVIPTTNVQLCDSPGYPDMADLVSFASRLFDIYDNATIVMNPLTYSAILSNSTQGSKEVVSIKVTQIMNPPGDISIAGSDIEIQSTDNTANEVATAIGNGTYTDWVIDSVVDNVVTFEAKIAGVINPISFDGFDTGVDGDLLITQAGSDATIEVSNFSVLTGATAPGNITIGGVAIPLLVTDDLPEEVAAAIVSAFSSNADWLVVADGADVSFTAKSAGAKQTITFTDTDSTGVTIGSISTVDGVDAVKEITTFTVSSGATVNNIITVDGVDVEVLMTDNEAGIASKINASAFDNWTTQVDNDTVTFTSKVNRNFGGIVFDSNDTGIDYEVVSVVDGVNNPIEGLDIFRQELVLNGTINGVKVIRTSYAPNATVAGSVVVIGGDFSNYGIGLASAFSVEPIKKIGENITYYQATAYFNGVPIVPNNFYALQAIAAG